MTSGNASSVIVTPQNCLLSRSEQYINNDPKVILISILGKSSLTLVQQKLCVGDNKCFSILNPPPKTPPGPPHRYRRGGLHLALKCVLFVPSLMYVAQIGKPVVNAVHCKEIRADLVFSQNLPCGHMAILPATLLCPHCRG